jgi:CP family cyanate transporter-like MFS transporter
LIWAVVAIGLATVARIGSHSVVVLFGTTVLVGIAIAITQTILPSLVKIYFPSRVALATGAYTVSLTVGAILAAGLTAPLYVLFDSWPLSLAVWGILAFVAVPGLIPLVRDDSSEPDRSPPDASKSGPIPWRNPLAWILMLFFAISSTIFYSGLTWLSARYVALGWDEATAGLLLTAFMVAQLGGMALVSAYGDKSIDRRPWHALMIAIVVISTGGVAFTPLSYPWIWATLLGVGTGGLFTLSLTLPIDFATGENATDRLSSMVMGGGYMLAAVGPFVTGGIRDLFGSYVPAFVGLTILGVVLTVCAVRLSPRSYGTIS